MKAKDLIFKNDSKPFNGKTFMERCILYPCEIYVNDDGKVYPGKEIQAVEYAAFLADILDRSKDMDQFVGCYLDNENYKHYQGYQELLKRERPEMALKYIHENFDYRLLEVSSDAGGVKVGNDTFSIVIPNGAGDGITRVAIFENQENFYAKDIMDFYTNVEGKRFYVYSGDTNGMPIQEMTGRYGVYIYKGYVAFVNWN